MRIVVLDSTAVPGVVTGPGAPAYFSRFVIEHLRQEGHDISIEAAFDEKTCAEADAVWTEWCNEEAYQAAESGVCKKLVIRMRGYDAWGPLDKLAWENVDQLVHESPFLKNLTNHVPINPARVHVIPSGVDLDNIVFRKRHTGPVVALVARAIADKGYQLAFEWARQRPDIQLHVALALAEANPRLTIYLQHTKPKNVTIHATVDTVKWLDELDANFLLSASNWETLGYTIVEAMALGIKPLIHDTPGAERNWTKFPLWRDFQQLNNLMVTNYASQAYRDYVEEFLNARTQNNVFADLILASSTRVTPAVEDIRKRQYAYRNTVLNAARAVELSGAVDPVADLVTNFRAQSVPHSIASDERYGAALMLSVAYFNRGDYANANVWACRALLDFARPDAFCLLGEIAEARDDIEEAVRWYKLACTAEDVPQRYRIGPLIDGRHERLRALQDCAKPRLLPAPPPSTYHVIVTVRNGVKWIDRCLASIRQQQLTNWRCIVVDDASTDGTDVFVASYCCADTRFQLVRNSERKWQARNTVEIARTVHDAEDVVILVDGDDWFADATAFTRIDETYRSGAWMTYGNVVEAVGRPSVWAPYPQRIARVGAFHEWAWCATAPRTFKRFLLDGLPDAAFMLAGAWPKLAGDVAVVLPLLQRACERAVPITDVIYVYNTGTSDNDHKVDPYEQVRVRDLLYDRPPQARLERS